MRGAHKYVFIWFSLVYRSWSCPQDQFNIHFFAWLAVYYYVTLSMGKNRSDFSFFSEIFFVACGSHFCHLRFSGVDFWVQCICRQNYLCFHSLWSTFSRFKSFEIHQMVNPKYPFLALTSTTFILASIFLYLQTVNAGYLINLEFRPSVCCTKHIFISISIFSVCSLSLAITFYLRFGWAFPIYKQQYFVSQSVVAGSEKTIQIVISYFHMNYGLPWFNAPIQWTFRIYHIANCAPFNYSFYRQQPDPFEFKETFSSYFFSLSQYTTVKAVALWLMSKHSFVFERCVCVCVCFNSAKFR